MIPCPITGNITLTQCRRDQVEWRAMCVKDCRGLLIEKPQENKVGQDTDVDFKGRIRGKL